MGSAIGSAKRCRVCNDEMDCYDYGGGSVWSCGTHGVRDWHFGSDAHWARGATPPQGATGRHLRGPKGPAARRDE